MTISDIQRAEQNSRNRSLLMAIAAVPLLILAVVGFGEESSSMNPMLRHGLWGVLVVVWLMILGTGGWLMVSRNVRSLMNDEVALLNRHRAIQTGFWVAMAAAFALYFASLEWEITLREGLRILANVAIAAALLHYAWLERP